MLSTDSKPSIRLLSKAWILGYQPLCRLLGRAGWEEWLEPGCWIRVAFCGSFTYWKANTYCCIKTKTHTQKTAHRIYQAQLAKLQLAKNFSLNIHYRHFIFKEIYARMVSLSMLLLISCWASLISRCHLTSILSQLQSGWEEQSVGFVSFIPPEAWNSLLKTCLWNWVKISGV